MLEWIDEKTGLRKYCRRDSPEYADVFALPITRRSAIRHEPLLRMVGGVCLTQTKIFYQEAPAYCVTSHGCCGFVYPTRSVADRAFVQAVCKNL